MIGYSKAILDPVLSLELDPGIARCKLPVSALCAWIQLIYGDSQAC